MCYMDSDVSCLVSNDMAQHQQQHQQQQQQQHCASVYGLLDPEVSNANPLADLLVDQAFLEQLVAPPPCSAAPASCSNFMFDSAAAAFDGDNFHQDSGALSDLIGSKQVHQDMLAFLPGLRSSSSPAASSSTGYAFSDDTTSVNSFLPQLHHHHPKLEEWGAPAAAAAAAETTAAAAAAFASYTNHDSTIVNCSSSSTKQQQQPTTTTTTMATMRESLYRMAIWRPVLSPLDSSLLPSGKPKRRNVRISKDPQTVAARHRRERISTKIRILQRLVPGGTKMDTASMLDEAIHYVKYLKSQVRAMELLEQTGGTDPTLLQQQQQQQNLQSGTITSSNSTTTSSSTSTGGAAAVAATATGGFFWPAHAHHHQQFAMDNSILGYQQVGY